MFKNNITLPQTARSASDTHPAIPATEVLRLRSENGATDRGASLYGNLTIQHSPTKEFGGGFRHVIRLNLREQGDIAPASAYLVVVNRDDVAGEVRAEEAVIGLLAALTTLNDSVQVKTSNSANGRLPAFEDTADEPNDRTLDEVYGSTSSALRESIQRLLARES